ncbi:Permease FtsX-like [Syntrophomonas zehnderi OL-4]|uniref:Permease FtsX-like n=1 Tax=Syntrophomonas zehnderi OL-4 TaxID=690567 RepID=A0A0E3W3H8_9FIRM|nr:ABC transporter permease [Syntrophomonas zehnderi]CFX83972.1 Permease FtsX-like [Syntrophomonas zehnderi OL-4]
MNKLDLLQMSLQNLRRRKARTFLTILGVVIGTASIIIMLSLSSAMEQNFKEQIARMGSLTVIDVYSGAGGEMPGHARPGELKLNDETIAEFSSLPGVKAVMGLQYSFMRVVAGKMVGDIQVIGVEPEKLADFDYEIETGRLLLPSDKDTLVFGKNLAYDFRNPRLSNEYMTGYMGHDNNSKPPVELINNKLLLTADMQYGERRPSLPDPNNKTPRPHEVRGVGILKESGDEKDYQALINIAVLRKIKAEDSKAIDRENRTKRNELDKQYDNIKIKVASMEEVRDIQKHIQTLGYQASSLSDMLESMKKTSRTMQAILGGIGAISLLVAAIGIANTMVMSIYERTREIGIIKVLGADMADIRRMFLLEAALIGLGGGILGIIFSYGVSWILNNIAGKYMANMAESTQISIIEPQLALGALIFATLIGLVSGYAPAHRAMKLSALEAIRSE